jgi:hypothetical protein
VNHQLLQYVLAHPATDTIVLGVMGTAFASTFPDQRPKTLDDLWAWIRDFVHQLANAKRPTQPKP